MLVVGGGITGVGVALDAVTRGLSVALLEAHDLAHGTSRWSSKLAHGGLRYLAKLQVGVAWESARERATLIDVIAPHLVRALPQLTPSFGRSAAHLAVEAGLRAGDAMRALAGTSAERLPRARRVDGRRGATPARRRSGRGGLRGGVLSWDGQLEDDARLVVALARTAAGHGARSSPARRSRGCAPTARPPATRAPTPRSRCGRVTSSTRPGSGPTGWSRDSRCAPARARTWSSTPSASGHPDAMLNVAVPGHFGRFVFAIPRLDGLVLIGLTDDPFGGAIPDVPEVERRRGAVPARHGVARAGASADLRGRGRPLRRAAPAAGHRRRRHRRRVAPPRRGRGPGTRRGHRGRAASSPPTAAWPRTPSTWIAARPGVRAGPCRTRQLPGRRRARIRRTAARPGAAAALAALRHRGRAAARRPRPAAAAGARPARAAGRGARRGGARGRPRRRRRAGPPHPPRPGPAWREAAAGPASELLG